MEATNLAEICSFIADLQKMFKITFFEEIIKISTSHTHILKSCAVPGIGSVVLRTNCYLRY